MSFVKMSVRAGCSFLMAVNELTFIVKPCFESKGRPAEVRTTLQSTQFAALFFWHTKLRVY